MPRLRSMAQMTTSRHAARLAISSLSPPLWPEPVRRPRWRAQDQHPARSGILERPQVDRLCDGGDRGPATGWRRRAGRGPARAARSGWRGHRVWGGRGRRCGGCRTPTQSRVPSPYVGDGLAACEPEPGPPPPQVHRGPDDLRAGQPDLVRDPGPGGNGALHPDLRAAPTVGPPRDRQHQGADAGAAASAGTAGPARRPPRPRSHAATVAATYSRSAVRGCRSSRRRRRAPHAARPATARMTAATATARGARTIQGPRRAGDAQRRVAAVGQDGDDV